MLLLRLAPQSRTNSTHAAVVLAVGFMATILWLVAGAVFEIFRLSVVAGVACAIGASVAAIGYLRGTHLPRWLWVWWLAVAVVLACNGWFFFNEWQTLGTNDFGVYFETAVGLSRTGSLFPQDELAVSHPGHGLYFGRILNSFQPAYIAWLAAFHRMGGLEGMRLANMPLIFLGLIFLYLSGRALGLARQGAVLAVLIFSANFYSLWYFRTPAVELLFFPLFWIYAWGLIRWLRQGEVTGATLAALAIAVMELARHEALLLWGPLVLAVGWRLRQTPLDRPGFLGWLCLSLAGAAIGLWVYYLAFFNASVWIETLRIASRQLTGQPVPTSINVPSFPNVWIGEAIVFWGAGVLLLLALAMPDILASAEKRRRALVLVFVVGPLWLFLVQPGVAFHVPWMFRRFWPVIFPAVVLLFSLAAGDFGSRWFHRNRMIGAVLIALVFAWLAAGVRPILLFADGQGLWAWYRATSAQLNHSRRAIYFFYDRYQSEVLAPTFYFVYGVPAVYAFEPTFTPSVYARLMRNRSHVYVVSSRPLERLKHPYFSAQALRLEQELEPLRIRVLQSTCDLRSRWSVPARDALVTYWRECLPNPPAYSTEKAWPIFVYRLDPDVVRQFVARYEEPQFQFSGSEENLWH